MTPASLLSLYTKIILTIFLLTASGGSLNAQADSLAKAIKGGKVSGYWRSYFMATQNQGDLQDWRALATGGMLKYQTGSFHRFVIGVAYYTSINLNIQDNTIRDTLTGKPSRYESGLFNVQDLEQRGIHILGELYLKFANKKHEVTLGRMKLKTPFLNPQDGRMIPTLAQGLWYKTTALKNTTLQAGWLTHIAPRSYSGFERMDNSMGIYPVGKNPDGTNSGYKGNVKSAGMGILALKYTQKKWGISAWNYFLENINNSLYVEAWYKWKIKKTAWQFSTQYLQQNRIKNGGNDSLHLTYFHQNMSNVIGGKIQLTTPQRISFSANYDYIAANGRFLFPREWGREPLYVFQKRERLEGTANTHAIMIDVGKDWRFKNKSLFKAKLGYGHYYRPDVKDFAFNKYAMPANSQLNLDLFYHLEGLFKGLVIEYLVSWKKPLKDTYDNPNFILNKVNMWNHNLILNYNF